MQKKKLYIKCLDEQMRSCNGGSQQWKVGRWYDIEGSLAMCKRGFHVTLAPAEWAGTRRFIAEVRNVSQEDEKKAVCAAVRLLKEISPRVIKAYEKAKAPAWEAYEKAKASALEAYKKAKASAWEAYEKATASAWEAYEKATASASEAYKKVLQNFLAMSLKSG